VNLTPQPQTLTEDLLPVAIAMPASEKQPETLAAADESLQDSTALSSAKFSAEDSTEDSVMDKVDQNSTQISPPETLTWKGELQIFLSTFLTIFLAEVGDKTQLTVLLMSAESGSPWTVFIGAGLALVATSLCGVLLGRWLSRHISPRLLERFAAILLLGIAALLLLDVWHG